MKDENAKSKVRSYFSSKFKMSEWVDWGRIKRGGHSIEDAAKDLFILKSAQSVETFEEAQRRLKLTDANIAARARALLIWSMLALALSIFLFFYALYHFAYGTFQAGFLVLALTGLAISLSFRYHFWHVQIKMRKLGCSFQDWFQYTFKGKNS